ncbi:MAG: ATP-binding protein [Kiritimatiellaeota bacterium]|nr:ATP-binding protein [Kiritimatiellota bacterium]
MSENDSFARTVRIAIPFEESAAVVMPKVPRVIVKKKGPTPLDESADAAPYQELLQSLYDGVLITDATGRIMDVNERAMDFLLYTKDELSRLNIINIIAGANEVLLETLRKNIEQRRYTLIEASCIRKDRTTFPAEIATNRLVLTPEGHLCFFVRNITKRKKAEEALKQTVTRLKEMDLSKSRFVANVSHELRTPLTIINTFVALVNDGVAGVISDQQKECLETVLRNCERLAGLIDDVLDLGRIESGREEFHRGRVNLADLLKQCHHDFIPQCLLRHQQFNLEMPETLPDVLCDRDKIAQVLTNLIGNANKFTPEEGVITLRAEQENNIIRIDIEDTGPGIRPEDQNRIFEAFIQLARTEDNTGSKGTGLGLAISKHIIDIHEGIIQVESVPGKGSRFFFTLPIYTEEKNLDAFITDRMRFMEVRDRQLAMLVLQVAAPSVPGGDPASKEAAERLRALAMEALDCTAEQTFLFEANQVLIVLLDGTEQTRDGVAARLQLTFGKQRQAIMDGIRMAYLEPTRAHKPREWLTQALALLKPLLIGPVETTPLRVLIVDDDASILNLMVRVLHESGVGLDLKSTTSGYDACIHFGEWNPDLVVLDLHLPDIDGRRVFDSMTKRLPHRTTKFLVVSGYRDDIDEIMQLGCDDSLCKPFDFDEFVMKVKRLLNLDSQPAGVSAKVAKHP